MSATSATSSERAARLRRLGAYAKAYAGSRRRAAYLGWLNHENMGDEAMLEAYERAFPRADLVEVPERILRLNGAARRLAAVRAIVLGGGTLIGRHAYREAFERLLAASPSAPAIMLGTGVEDPAFHGANEPEMREELRRWSAILPRFVSVDVRGPRSRELLAEVGVNANVVGDPALLLAPEQPAPPPEDRVVGVNLSLSMEMWGGRPQEVVGALAGALRPLVAEGWTVRFVPLWPADVESARALERELGRTVEVTEGFLHLPTLLDALAGCRLFAGQKLHSVVLASAMNVPSVMLEYHPKCRDFQRSVEREEWTVRTDGIAAEAIVERLAALDADYDEHRRRLIEAVGELRRRLHKSVERSRAALPPALR